MGQHAPAPVSNVGSVIRISVADRSFTVHAKNVSDST